MKKTIIYFLAALGVISVLALTACSSGDNSTETSSSSSRSEQQTEGIYQHLKKAKNEIWYLTDKVGKEEYPDSIYVFNKGKVKGFNIFHSDEAKSFGDLAKMTDEEIIDYYESQEGTELKEFYESTAIAVEKNVTNKADSEQLLAALEPYSDGRGKLPTVDYTAKLVTDDTGNGIASEDFEIAFLDVKKPDRNIGNFWNYTLKLKYPTSTMTVYNSTYNGFETEDEVHSLFITRSKNQFTLDKIGTKGIEEE